MKVARGEGWGVQKYDVDVDGVDVKFESIVGQAKDIIARTKDEGRTGAALWRYQRCGMK